MTDPPPTLVEFLRVRLDEDEAAARAAKPGPWTQDGGSIYATHPTDEVVDWVYDDSWEHIARHDPVRLLAEVDAKRRIVELHHPVDPCDAHDASLESVACPTLRLLALPYADHPDYNLEWSPG